MDRNDGVLRLCYVDLAHAQSTRHISLPVRAVEQRHCAEALQQR